MKSSALFRSTLLKLTTAALLPTVFVAPPPARAQEPAETRPATETEVARRSLARARALAAIGKLEAAAAELEALRASTREASVREVARVLLVSVYVELPDYVRATALLDEGFRERAAASGSDAQAGSYFALAGQTINSVRQHLDRFRAYGLSLADADLPPEAGGDLEQLRRLLEKLVEQAKVVSAERASGTEAKALLEDAATVRLRVARDAQDRAHWQTQVSDARQQLFAAETRIASISSLPAGRRAPAAQPDNPASAANAANAANAETQPQAQPSGRAPSPPATGQPGTEPSNAQATPARPAAGGSRPAPAAGTAGGQGTKALHAVGSLVPLARQRVSPSYPQIAKAGRVTGSVTVYMVVNEKGEVESVQRAEGPVQLQQAAVEAARRWKFNPTVVDGQPVRVSGHLSFNFAL